VRAFDDDGIVDDCSGRGRMLLHQPQLMKIDSSTNIYVVPVHR